MDIFGYFDKPGAPPTYDPGKEAPCPICTAPLSTAPVKTISLMKPGDNRSYFFRAHKSCWESADKDEQQHVEGLLIDERLSH